MNNKTQFQSNDIKYRALKVAGDEDLLKVLYHTDSLYDLDAARMRQWVVREEHRLAEQTRMLQLAGEKKKKRRI